MRVVIAEDEWLLAMALRRQVELYGYQVVGTASTGKEALELCRRESPDLVLMDVQMPEMDGLEATRTLMQEAPRCVVIITGKAQRDQLVRQAGVMRYVVKPLLGPEIPQVVENARQRFENFLRVSEESSSPHEALEAWLLVQQAVETLLTQGGTEEQTFQELFQEALAQGVSLVAAAQMVLAVESDSDSCE